MISIRKIYCTNYESASGSSSVIGVYCDKLLFKFASYKDTKELTRLYMTEDFRS